MKQQKRKGFTLVELLIVIAILAVLATVSIVGYTQFIQKARISNDAALVKQLNDLLLANEVVDGKAPTMSAALEIARVNGFDVTKFTPTAKNYSYIWDSETNRFLLINENQQVITPSGVQLVAERSFAVAHNEAELATWQEKGFSTYLADDFKLESGDSITVSRGIDAGNCSSIKTINYTNTTAAQEVIIRTNGGKLIVDGFVAADNSSGDTIIHHGTAERIDVNQVYSSSYHEYGEVLVINISKGRLVLEEGASVTTAIAKTADSIIETKIDGVTVYAVENAEIIGAEAQPYDGRSADKYVKGEKYFEGGSGSESNPYLLSQSSTLSKVPEISGCYKLISDIVLEDELRLIKYSVTLDLNGYTLSLKYGDGVTPTDNATISVRSKTFTIKDTSAEQTGAIIGGISTNNRTNCAIRVGNSAKLNIYGGTFRSTDNGASTIHVYTGIASSTAATVKIYGGTFETTPYNGTYFVLNHEDGMTRDCTITVYAGTFINYNPGVTPVDPVNTKTGKIKLASGSTTKEESIEGGGTKYIVTAN